MSWDEYRKGFEQLAREEERMQPNQRLCATCDYSNPPAILDEKGKPRQAALCVIRSPESGLWTLSGGVSEGFLEKFRTHAARSGLVLGGQEGTDPEGVWLHRLYSYVRANYAEFLAPKIGGRSSELRRIDTILRVCEASAIFSSLLERKALESLSSGKTHENLREELGKLSYVRLTENREHNLRTWLVEHGIPPTREALDSFDQVDVAKEAVLPSVGALQASADNTRKAFLGPILDEKGFSVHDWAESAKVDFHTANDYLTGKTKPHPSTLKKLADALGLKVTNLPK
jgi:hypothetical protein